MRLNTQMLQCIARRGRHERRACSTRELRVCAAHAARAREAGRVSAVADPPPRLALPMPARALHTPEKVSAPCQGTFNEHHGYKIVIEAIFTSIASTLPYLAIFF